jgi:hypothetical protein
MDHERHLEHLGFAQRPQRVRSCLSTRRPEYRTRFVRRACNEHGRGASCRLLCRLTGLRWGGRASYGRARDMGLGDMEAEAEDGGGVEYGSREWWRWEARARAFRAWADWAESPGCRRTLKAERPKCGAKCRDGHPCQALPVWDETRNAPRNGPVSDARGALDRASAEGAARYLSAPTANSPYRHSRSHPPSAVRSARVEEASASYRSGGGGHRAEQRRGERDSPRGSG